MAVLPYAKNNAVGEGIKYIPSPGSVAVT